MKKFEEKYLSLIKKIELSNEDARKIKQNICEKANKKSLILKPIFITLILLSVCSTITVAANVLIKQYKTTINENSKKEVLFTSKIDKVYTDNLLKENDYYSINELEEKLDLKFLRNKHITNDLFKLTKLDKKNNKIAKLNFWLVDSKKDELTYKDLNLGFEINTKYSLEDGKLAFSGNVKMEYYYIKNLNTEAIIFETTNDSYGPLLANFVYDEIIYSINLEKAFFTKNDLYIILDSFYKR
ncbi:MAG: hypothetical protein E7172_02050 [Firmicutes bacterium]|nr:hypothetical protein [Bacillota bacterium]